MSRGGPVDPPSTNERSDISSTAESIIDVEKHENVLVLGTFSQIVPNVGSSYTISRFKSEMHSEQIFLDFEF